MPRLVFLVMTALALGALTLGLGGCGGGPGEPLPELLRALKDVPTFSIVLEDMKEEGTFSTEYFQKFRILLPRKTSEGSPEPALKSQITDWRQVPQNWYQRTAQFLGLTIYSRSDGKPNQQAGPPGYEYVGNPQYGRWRQDSGGSRIWEFFAGYAMMNMLLGNRPIYYRDYQDYRGMGNRPYYGPMGRGGRRSYGTQGSMTQKQKPNFYQRRMARQASQQRSFSQRVSNRIGRTRTGFRGRSGGFGK